MDHHKSDKVVRPVPTFSVALNWVRGELGFTKLAQFLLACSQQFSSRTRPTVFSLQFMAKSLTFFTTAGANETQEL
jgi:hypothetical protein